LWEATFGGDYLLIGSPWEVDIDPRTLTDRLGNERLRADLGRMKTRSPAALMNKLIMTDAAIPRYIEGVPLHTDDNALLEYSAPRALLRERSTGILEALYAHRQNPVSVLRSRESVEIPTAMARELLKRFEARKDVLAGFKHYAKGAVQGAIERFEHALAISPQDYDATYLLAELYYKIGSRFKDAKRPVEATRAYEKSVEAIDNFIRVDRALLADHFKLDVIYARANIKLGNLALKANRLEQAVAAFEKSTSGEVRLAEAYNNLGIVYERTGRYDEAVTQYQRAIELNPSHVSAYMNMGNTRLKQKKFREAIESYRQVKKLRPDFAITNYNLGVAYFQQNELAKAEKEWERALALKPDFSQAQKRLNGVRNKIISQ
jgi:tetratricopeptide (TPR) repeat protein